MGSGEDKRSPHSLAAAARAATAPEGGVAHEVCHSMTNTAFSGWWFAGKDWAKAGAAGIAALSATSINRLSNAPANPWTGLSLVGLPRAVMDIFMEASRFVSQEPGARRKADEEKILNQGFQGLFQVCEKSH
jgi:hypothetical protein